MTRVGARFLKDSFSQEVPVGTINGSNTVFTIGQTPDEVDAILLFKNGLYQRQTTDYTVSGTTLTFTSAPAVGSDLICIYISREGE